MSEHEHIARGGRVRASHSAIKATLTALKDAGVLVERVCVSGGQVEIHCGHVEGHADSENDGRLKPW